MLLHLHWFPTQSLNRTFLPMNDLMINHGVRKTKSLLIHVKPKPEPPQKEEPNSLSVLFHQRWSLLHMKSHPTLFPFKTSMILKFVLQRKRMMTSPNKKILHVQSFWNDLEASQSHISEDIPNTLGSSEEDDEGDFVDQLKKIINIKQEPYYFFCRCISSRYYRSCLYHHQHLSHYEYTCSRYH